MMAMIVGRGVAIVSATGCSGGTAARFSWLAAKIVVIVVEGGKVTVTVVLLGHDVMPPERRSASGGAES